MLEILLSNRFREKKDKIALMICTCCGTTFSERRGTVFFGLHHSMDTVVTALSLYLANMSINDIERFTNVTKKTILSWIRKAGSHIKAICDAFLLECSISECQIDEMWTFVKMKRKSAKRKQVTSDDVGDEWIYLAIDPNSKVVIHWHIGKHTKDNTRLFLEGLKRKLDGNIPLFTSDEFSSYSELFTDLYSEKKQPQKTGKRGRPRTKPIKVINKDLKYAQIKKTRKKGKVTKIDKEIVVGDKTKIEQLILSSNVSNDINTSFVERMNATLRHCLRRLARKTYCFSKSKNLLIASVDLFIGYYNFVKIHSTLKTSPLSYKGIIHNPWSLFELLSLRI